MKCQSRLISIQSKIQDSKILRGLSEQSWNPFVSANHIEFQSPNPGKTTLKDLLRILILEEIEIQSVRLNFNLLILAGFQDYSERPPENLGILDLGFRRLKFNLLD